MIRKARHFTKRAHFQFFVLGCVTVIEGLIITLSLGFLTTDIRSDLLFSEWMDDPRTCAPGSIQDCLNTEGPSFDWHDQ